MKFSCRRLLLLFPFVCGTLFMTPIAAAQDGPGRQRAQEFLNERPQHEVDAAAKLTQPGDYTFTASYGGLARRYRVHVPSGYDAAKPAPLLVVLHGGGGDMNLQANDTYYGQISKSDREGFVAVFPNGFSRFKNGKFATWNAGNCCGGARDGHVDDVGFIRQVVAGLGRRMNIDRKRIYAAGMSNGAMMAYRLACEMSDVFAAIAAVAGTDNTVDCRPERPVSILHVHARDDTHVLFDGGIGSGVRDPSKVADFTSVAGTVAKWARLDGCTAPPQRNLQTAGAYCEVYSPCRANAQVQLCVTETGGHSWPDGVKPRGGEPPSQAISANDVMWEFFKRH